MQKKIVSCQKVQGNKALPAWPVSLMGTLPFSCIYYTTAVPDQIFLFMDMLIIHWQGIPATAVQQPETTKVQGPHHPDPHVWTLQLSVSFKAQ